MLGLSVSGPVSLGMNPGLPVPVVIGGFGYGKSSAPPPARHLPYKKMPTTKKGDQDSMLLAH